MTHPTLFTRFMHKNGIGCLVLEFRTPGCFEGARFGQTLCKQHRFETGLMGDYQNYVN
jgi:hypothetical protein